MWRMMKQEQGDRGAVAVLVGMWLSLLLIFAGLAIDLGASFAKRQELQNGADAGALALAQEIAPNPCASPSASTAGYFVENNVRVDPTEATGVASCVPGRSHAVSVRADAIQDHWFLPMVGRSSSPIAATATVEWGAPIVPSTIPLAISACAFESAVDVPSLDNKITVWFPDSSSSSAAGPPPCGWHPDYPAGGFGLLDNTSCVAEVRLSDWTVGSAPGGSATSSCSFSTLLDQRHLIPIFTGGEGVIHQGQPARYKIKTFAAFTLTGYHLKHGSDKHGGDACFGPVPAWGRDNYCMVGQFEEFVSIEDAEAELRTPRPSDTVIYIRMSD